jgi:type I restriction enzyme S subunit
MVPEGWTAVQMGDLVDIAQETVSTSTLASNDVVRLYSLAAFDQGQTPESVPGSSIGSSKVEVPAQAVLLSKLNPHIPRIWQIQHDGAVLAVASTEFWPLVPKRTAPSVDLRFLKHSLSSPGFLNHPLIQPASSTNSHRRIRRSAFERYSQLLPPLPEQQKIADVLSSVDDAIAATRRVIQQTKRVRQGLLRTLMAHGIGHAQFKETEIGEIPKSWDVVRLEALGGTGTQTVRSGPFGSSLKGEHFTDDGTPVLTIQSLGEGRIDDEGLFYVSAETAAELKEYEVREGDLVFSRVADVGRSVVIEGRAEGWIISSNLIRISTDNHRVNPWYLMYCIVGGGPVTRQIERLAGDHGRPVVSSTMLKHLQFPVPPKEEQDEVVSRITAVERACRCSEEALDRLDQMKRGLMQDLLTGRVRVQPA